MTNRLLFFGLILLIACGKQPQQQLLFEALNPETSGVDFINKLEHNLETRDNLFDFDYFYNGAGVGIADLNNDGLQDLFFTGNQVANSVYQNLGNLKFQDVSQSAGLNSGKGWSNGVTFADVNADGRLDIYVSQGGPRKQDQRKNKLYINQGNFQFEEQSERYGLADDGFSTQSVFLDYDKDGDLDCFVMNENALYGNDPLQFYKKVSVNEVLFHASCSHLYENRSGKYIDVTERAGMLKPSFGLGLCASDLNKDGWIDIYVSNDYYIPDAMYINNGDGTFTDQIKTKTGHTAFFGMGVDVADLDGDTDRDIMILDMASADHYRAKTLMASMNTDAFDLLTKTLQFPYQYMFNAVMLNTHNEVWSNNAHRLGLAKSDWSWSCLMQDFDNDSDLDIFISNGYRRYAADNDTKIAITKAKLEYQGKVPLSVKQDLYLSMPSEKLPNLFYEQTSKLNFQENGLKSGLSSPSFSNGAATADLDNDGDLDLIVNNMDHTAFVYENQASERGTNYLQVSTVDELSEHFAEVRIWIGDQSWQQEIKRVRGYFSAVQPIAHFGLADFEKVDRLEIQWSDGTRTQLDNPKINTHHIIHKSESALKVPSEVVAGENLMRKVNIPGLEFIHRENIYDDFAKETLLPYAQSTFGPPIGKGDFNKDGLVDLIIGGAAGQAGQIFIQRENGFLAFTPAVFIEDADFEDVAISIGDLNDDGNLDICIASGGNAAFDQSAYVDRIYFNDGEGHFQEKLYLDEEFAFPSGDVAILDFDNDGDNDVFIANRIIPQSYPKSAPSVLYKNENGAFEPNLDSWPVQNTGIVNAVDIADLNNDSWNDMVLATEWGQVIIVLNNKGTFQVLDNYENDSLKYGWWFSVKIVDYNNDGLLDIVAGNVGENIKFKASAQKPYKVFANDFDQNGTYDIVLSKMYKGNYVPERGRECSSEQMPFIKEKFPTYDLFAKASIDDIYGDNIDSSLQLSTTTFSSMVFINEGNLRFKGELLPSVLQSFPIMDIALADLNGDAHSDLIFCGNIYNTEVETPRLDATNPAILFGNAHSQQVKLISDARGDLRSLISMRYQGKPLMVLTSNNGPIMTFTN